MTNIWRSCSQIKESAPYSKPNFGPSLGQIKESAPYSNLILTLPSGTSLVEVLSTKIVHGKRCVFRADLKAYVELE